VRIGSSNNRGIRREIGFFSRLEKRGDLDSGNINYWGREEGRCTRWRYGRRRRKGAGREGGGGRMRGPPWIGEGESLVQRREKLVPGREKEEKGFWAEGEKKIYVEEGGGKDFFT